MAINKVRNGKKAQTTTRELTGKDRVQGTEWIKKHIKKTLVNHTADKEIYR